MFIQSLNINSHIGETLGLQEFNLNSLEKVVVLTGENGSGKTRVLASVHWLLTHLQRLGYRKFSSVQKEQTRIGNLLKSAYRSTKSHLFKK